MPDQDERQHRVNSLLRRILRLLGLIIGVIIGWEAGINFRLPAPEGNPSPEFFWRIFPFLVPILLAAALGTLFFIVTPQLTISVFGWFRREIRRLPAADLVAAGIGLLIGGLVSTLLAWPISLLPPPFGQILPFVSAVIICSAAVVALVTKKREIFGLLGRRNADAATVTASTSPNAGRRAQILVDTSAIIDGRMVELVRTGFLRDDLLIPQFVLKELHLVADSADMSRRTRGRRGLDVLERLRHEEQASIEISDIDAFEEGDVDSKLVRVAKTYDYLILTGDQNLNRVAALQDVRVLNIHELAYALRPPLIPGEEMSLRIIQAGREYDQGVGYLDDGTMVVVEAGKSFIGQDVVVVVTRTLQNSAGRMAFAQVKNAETVR
jgi:uncharacterized protein YacL